MNYVAHPTNLAFGNTDSTKLYATIKSGAVYVLNTSIPEGRGPALVAKIYAAGKIALKNWTRVRNAPTKTPVKKADTRTITTEQRLPYGQYWKQRALAAENALKAARLEQPESEEVFEAEMLIEEMENKRAIAAKKGWATRRANAQPGRLTRDEYIAKHGSLPEDKSYSVVDANGYPISMAELMGEAS